MELDDVGFVVTPGAVAPPQLSPLAAVYDALRRDDKQGTNQAARMRPETLVHIGALAKYVLSVESQLPVPDARA